MVKLNKIYTKAGDKGKTGLVNGKRIFKDNIRIKTCLLYTSPSPRDKRQSRMPSSA